MVPDQRLGLPECAQAAILFGLQRGRWWSVTALAGPPSGLVMARHVREALAFR
jgi:hypothetical protein